LLRETPRHAMHLGAAILLGLALLLSLRPDMVDRPAISPTGETEAIIGALQFPAPGTVLDLDPSPAALVRTLDGNLIALSLRCPYLGCRLIWNPLDQVFSCPCHGDRFGPDGSWRAGAAPSHLHRHPLEDQDGNGMRVDLSGIFLMIGRETAPDVQYPTSLVELHM
jgi:nitrite reductase/ring-hydroxylating ferredoxin subunit